MLRAPISVRLRGRIDEAAVARMWRNIRARRRTTPFSPRTALLAALWCVGVAVVGLLIGRWPSRSTPTMAVVVTPPLSMQDGTHIGIADIPDGAPRLEWALSDGSHLAFDRATRWEPLANSATQMVSTVRRGMVTFDVKPGGPRRWVIECGPVSVEVVGTRFSVYRDPSRVSVTVERGVVIVRGDPVPDAVQSLTAGQRIDVPLIPQTAPVAPAAPSQPPPQTPAWMTAARGGKFREAYDTLGGAGLATAVERATDADRLLMLADVARLSGHPADAVAPLERIVSEHPESQRAGLAAVTLGRLLLDQLSQPAESARVLERALGLRIPTSLREDVFARLAEAQSRAGNRAGAHETYQAYDREFPSGRLHDVVQRAAGEPP